MLDHLLDELIQVNYSVVDAFGNIKAQMFVEQLVSCSQDPKHSYCEVFALESDIL